MEKRTVFLSGMNNSGQGIVAKLLNKSRDVRELPIRKVKDIGITWPKLLNCQGTWTEAMDILASPVNYDWIRITSEWEVAWCDDRVRVASLPLGVIWEPMLKGFYEEAVWIFCIRDPYAICSKLKNQYGYEVARSIKHWLRLAQMTYQKFTELEHTYLWGYEDICSDTIAVKALLAHEFRIDDMMIMNFGNRNLDEIAKLEPSEVNIISGELEKQKDFLGLLGYKIA